MNSDEVPGKDIHDEKSSSSSIPTDAMQYNRTISQDLRYLDDALTHAIDQLTTFNSETMSDLSLKYEYIRNNESRVIGFFARQLMLLRMQKSDSQNGGFHSEYSKLNRFLSVLNLNKKSIEYIVQRMTFDDLLNGKATAREKLLYDAETNEVERRDFRNALNALKDCIEYFSHGGTNDNGRFFWHIETPPPATVTPYSLRQHRSSDTVLPVSLGTESVKSPSVTSSVSTDFGITNASNNNNHATITPFSHTRSPNSMHTPPPSRSNHLSVNGKGKCEHPNKKSSIDPSIFTNLHPQRSIDLQLPDGGSPSRRGSYGSDTESRLPSELEHTLENGIFHRSHELAMRKIANQAYSNHQHSNPTSPVNKQPTTLSTGFLRQYIGNSTRGFSVDHIQEENQLSISIRRKKHLWNRSASKDGAATPKSPTVRSPTFSNSPMGSAHNSDTETDPKTPDTPLHNTHSPVLRHRMAHKIQHKWSNLMKLSTCNVCSRKIFFLGTKCNNCKFDRTRVFKFSFCDVCKKQVFRGKPCLHCKYKCHKECVQNAPANCGFSERNLRRVIDDSIIQHALGKTHITPSDSTSPTPTTPISTPGSPALQLPLSGYLFNSSLFHGSPSICVNESVYPTQYDPECWVVIETNPKSVPELPESQSDSDVTSTNQTDTGIELTMPIPDKLTRQLSHSEPVDHERADFKTELSISLEDDLDSQTPSLSISEQDWVILFSDIKIIEEVRRSSGSLMKAHWHGELAVRMIKPHPKLDETEFLQQLKKQVSRLRKVRHEYLNLYTGVCIESPNYAIASSWIRGLTLYEMIHIRNDTINFNIAVQYAAQIAQAMSYLHEKSINHMSLRTTNIFIQNNRIVLTDYGLIPLSKCYRYNEQPAIIAPRGWLSYLAPEILRKIDPYDEQSLLHHTPQTDVYAFGTVWYELLFREFPYAKQPAEYIIWRAGNSLKQPLSSVHISKNAKDIINQCWSFVPDDRPDFAMLCKSLTKMPGKRALVRSPSTPLQHHGNPLAHLHFK